MAATYPCGQPGSSSFASHWRVFATPTRRYHGRMLIHPSPLRCHPHWYVFAHACSGPSRVRRRLLRTCLRDPIPLAIRPVNFSGVTPNLDSNSWTLWQSCNVVNPGKISTRIPLAHHQFCPKICILVNF